MLTAKLSCYSPEEVDFLIEILKPILEAILNHSNTNCGVNDDCNSCKGRHVCDDVYNMYTYLIFEADNGYPHCSK